MPVNPDAPDADLAPYQHSGAGKGKAFDLKHIDPAAKPCSGGNKTEDKARVTALALEIDALQNLLYANRRQRLLVVLQGLDTSGKDGTVRGVFGSTTPLGVRAIGWKAPNDDELAHDYLWRIHQRVPAAGEIVVFNRSHYEDVLVPVVNGWITPEQTAQRYAQINDFERMLTDNGTVVLKFLLHISKDEQRVRLQERIDDPAKHWKFSLGDLTVRQQWDAYQAAYAAAISATGTPWAPWTVVPSDSKTHRNLMVATRVVQALRALKLQPPAADPALAHLKIE